jgi:hypothetical protein
MRLWTSRDGGERFSADGVVAKVGHGYGGTASLALNSRGGGFVTYQDGSGLEVADLAPIARAKKRR